MGEPQQIVVNHSDTYPDSKRDARFRVGSSKSNRTFLRSAAFSMPTPINKGNYVTFLESADSSYLHLEIVSPEDLRLLAGALFPRFCHTKTGFHHANRTINKTGHIKHRTALYAVSFRLRRAPILQVFVVGPNFEIYGTIVQPIVVQVIRFQPFRTIRQQSMKKNRPALSTHQGTTDDVVCSSGLRFTNTPGPRVLAHFLQSGSVHQCVEPLMLGFTAFGPRPSRPELNRKMVSAVMPFVPHIRQYAAASDDFYQGSSTKEYQIGDEPGQPSFVLSPKGSRTGPEIPQSGVSSIRRHLYDREFLEAGRREDPWLSRNLEPLDTTRARLTGTRFKAFVAQQHGTCNPLAGLAAASNRAVEHGPTLKDFVL